MISCSSKKRWTLNQRLGSMEFHDTGHWDTPSGVDSSRGKDEDRRA